MKKRIILILGLIPLAAAPMAMAEGVIVAPAAHAATGLEPGYRGLTHVRQPGGTDSVTFKLVHVKTPHFRWNKGLMIRSTTWLPVGVTPGTLPADVHNGTYNIIWDKGADAETGATWVRRTQTAARDVALAQVSPETFTIPVTHGFVDENAYISGRTDSTVSSNIRGQARIPVSPNPLPIEGPDPDPEFDQALDGDGDGIPDQWEREGYDANGDGKIDVDLPAMGADPRHKDIFVEADYTVGNLPSDGYLGDAVNAFSNAPVTNLDGTTGIALHIDAGTKAGSHFNFGGGNEIQGFESLNSVATVRENKAKYMDSARKKIFHYMWFAKISNACGWGYVPGSEFLVQPSCGHNAFVHELGHNLGLGHGGMDGVNNKPNYLSVMNYSFSHSSMETADGGLYRYYSLTTTRDLDESALSEKDGLGSMTRAFKTKYWDANGKEHTTSGSAEKDVDWNGNGRIDSGTVSVDINHDGKKTVLKGQNDWARLRFVVGDVGVKTGVNDAETPVEIKD